MAHTKGNKDIGRHRRKMLEKSRIPWSHVVPLMIFVVTIGTILVYTNSIGMVKSSSYGRFPFSCLSENTELHVHPWLRIVINGQNITIPAGIGIENPDFQIVDGVNVATSASCFEPCTRMMIPV